MSRQLIKQWSGNKGVALDPTLGIAFDFGTSVPADASVGYAPNAIFLDIDATGGVGVYVNRGTKASANFDFYTGVDLSTLTATAAEINARCAAASRRVAVTDAATYTVLAANSGKIHVMPDFTSSCTLALPAASDGLEYTFISKAIAADAQNWIFQVAEAGVSFLGGLLFLDTDDPADTVASVFPNGSSNDFMTIVKPAGGTRIHLFCDGTNWIVNGMAVSDTVPTFSDT